MGSAGSIGTADEHRMIDGLVTVGIDGSNVRFGGGLTYLSQLLSHAEPAQAGIGTVHLWAGTDTLAVVPDRSWLRKHVVAALDRGLGARIWWRETRLPHALRQAGCDVLFAPGTLLPRRLRMPSVVLSQNMLPFEPDEAARFGRGSAMWWRWRLLRFAQTRAFNRASGILFLTDYARTRVMEAVGPNVAPIHVIPHGLEPRFLAAPRPSVPLAAFGPTRPFRLLYVSVVNHYKHQWRVVEAVGRLRAAGLPVSLDLVGVASPAMRRVLQRSMAKVDPQGSFVRYRGPIAFKDIHRTYQEADAFVFASSCENLPNIVIEAMGAGLAIASSDRGPMPEALGDAALYFDPLDTGSVTNAMRMLIIDPELRSRLAARAFARAHAYSWTICSQDTLEFVASIARNGRPTPGTL